MTSFSIGSFNVKNLIGADQEYYRYESYTSEEYAWKQNWIARQLLTMNADIVCFQEIFDQASLQAVIDESNHAADDANANLTASTSKHSPIVSDATRFKPYAKDQVFFAPNANDGSAGQRRPGLAMVSRFGFEDTPEMIQALAEPLVIDFPSADLDHEEKAGSYTLKKLSRPIIKAKIKVGNQVLTVFNCHLKSKLGEYIQPIGADFAPENDLVHYLPAQRALGALRALLRRSAEAYLLRKLIAEELIKDHPVMVLGDFNDGEYSVTSSMIKGERPFKNYAWMRRHDAEHKNDRYSEREDLVIRAQIEQYQLTSAEAQMIKRNQGETVYTTAFAGVYESIDQILMSQHFIKGSANNIGVMDDFSVFNDHITERAHADAPYPKLASDHGQIVAHMKLI
ncbi:MAG: endonuclease/exonuclease/phosphatase family protein [Methylophilaceae bacterium]|nr:endonuclease/exonuclease/phosphatase family protein [Methylophilaceae bacterium]MDG2293775.1 endonuclease/exonuclease/phosphatase family protein [Methylophilaceae bacterium]